MFGYCVYSLGVVQGFGDMFELKIKSRNYSTLLIVAEKQRLERETSSILILDYVGEKNAETLFKLKLITIVYTFPMAKANSAYLSLHTRDHLVLIVHVVLFLLPSALR